jgi:RimJ/RimL family protein N-acetyltransferase
VVSAGRAARRATDHDRVLQMGRAMWVSDGLSYWTARSLTLDEVVGLGGARRHRDRTWTLSYRIATSHQGQGLGTELSIAANC